MDTLARYCWPQEPEPVNRHTRRSERKPVAVKPIDRVWIVKRKKLLAALRRKK